MHSLVIPNMLILHPIPTVLKTSIAETKIGSVVQSIWKSQSFLSVKLKPGQLSNCLLSRKNVSEHRDQKVKTGTNPDKPGRMDTLLLSQLNKIWHNVSLRLSGIFGQNINYPNHGGGGGVEQKFKY